MPALVYASSLGAYSPAPRDRRRGETWPTNGVPTSFYARHKAEVERRLDRLEHDHPGVRVVRLRPALIFKRGAATGVRRLFAGPLLPSPLVAPRRIRLIPDVPGLCFQCVHSSDVADAYRLALLSEVRGPFNVAAEPVLDSATLARLLAARRVRVPARVARAVVAGSYRLHLQPSEPGWLDMGLNVPLMDTGHARRELGWEPRRSADEAFLELLSGIAGDAGADTPPLDPEASGPARVREIATGVGRRNR